MMNNKNKKFLIKIYLLIIIKITLFKLFHNSKILINGIAIGIGAHIPNPHVKLIKIIKEFIIYF